MKRDANDVLRQNGPDALREAFDKAPRETKQRAKPKDPNVLPVVDFADLAAVSSKSWVVQRLLGAGETSCFFGEPGAGKSVVAQDIGLHVAVAQLTPTTTWQGRKLKGGAVLFVALERAGVVARRALAFGREYALFGTKLPFGVLRGPLDFRENDTATKIIATMQSLAERHRAEPRMIVVDTVNRALNGGDENSPKDMGALIAKLGLIQASLVGVHIMVVHHQPADGRERMRGHGSLLGALDVAAHVTNGATRMVQLVKASDFEDDQRIGFALRGIVIGQDDQGDDISAPVVIAEQAPAPSAKKAARLPKGAKAGLNSLREAIDELGAVPPASNHIPLNAKAVTLDQWRDYAYRRGISTSDKPRARQAAFERAGRDLKDANAIGIWEPHVWLI